MSSLIPVYYQLNVLDSVHFHPSEFCIWKYGGESTESAYVLHCSLIIALRCIFN